MFPYLITFALCLLCTYHVESLQRGKHTKEIILFSALAILFPSILAGVRDITVGTDTSGYVNYVWFKTGFVHDINVFIQQYNTKVFKVEIGYVILNFIARFLFHDIHGIYFLANLIPVSFFYLTAWDNRKKASMTFTMFVFLFLFYNTSLNMVRQTIALSFVVYSIKYLEQRRYLKLMIWGIVALLFHNSTVIYLLFIAFYMLSNKMSKKRETLLLVLVFLFSAVTFLYLDSLMIILIAYGIIPPEYMYRYGSGGVYGSGESITNSVLAINIFVLVVVYISRKYNAKSKGANTPMNISLVALILSLLNTVSTYANRIGLYFSYPADIIYFPRALNDIKNKDHGLYKVLMSLSVGMILFYWYFSFILRNGNETYPYSSSILGIMP